ncbi:hypothetical protein [Microbulbifer sp. GL-2]|uniref:hypothetical protein n=1 Tax=Microbulbifer sp. GL-2 TaxID=2591606 RepID=UPI001164E5E5|nr:hypothetical protein [Microbulbifer sp. GL-2]BBM03962.1 hypothetical protein GL2_40360 [Microbulbifer sp. GL-2]
MNVKILEKETGRIVATYPININGLHYQPTESDYISEAWKCAIEDRAVDPDKKTSYSFTLID